MKQEEKAKQLALTLIGEDQTPEPLIEVLIEMAQWQKQQITDKFSEWCQEEFYVHPHDCHVVQYVSDKALEDIDDFIEEFKKKTK